MALVVLGPPTCLESLHSCFSILLRHFLFVLFCRASTSTHRHDYDDEGDGRGRAERAESRAAIDACYLRLLKRGLGMRPRVRSRRPSRHWPTRPESCTSNCTIRGDWGQGPLSQGQGRDRQCSSQTETDHYLRPNVWGIPCFALGTLCNCYLRVGLFRPTRPGR